MPRADRTLSTDPADVLVRELLRSGRTATVEEINQITQRIATAPFPTAEEHRRRHCADGQWTEQTTVEEYANDLRRAVHDEHARLMIYVRRGGNMAAVLAATDRTIHAGRRGPTSIPLLFVAYSADRGIMVTGYQASALVHINLPEDVRWLR